ncbi:MAG TPA: hypothetical protein PK829_05515 [Promineifilum sp.]|nr:hypothetical protein [Promineifilum sp.]
MNTKATLRIFLMMTALLLGMFTLVATRPAAAAPDAFGLTTKVEPAGKGTVDVSPPPPYSENQVVSLTATPIAGWTFDKWVLASDLVWWDENWDYRVTVTAAAAGYARKDKPAEVALNFTQLWSSLGKTGTLDPNSIRVVEVDGSDAVIDDTVPFQFDKAKDFNAASKAAGTLVLIMEGNTPAGATRRYHVYFDVTGKGFAAPNVPSQITFNPSATDQGKTAYQLDTPVGTYFYHTKGGGFSSFNDLGGNDWINWNSAPENAGDFRGIPNLVHPNNGGYFHPGRTGMTTTLISQGPIKVTFESFEANNPPAGRDRWRGIWEVYPTYVNFTIVSAPYNYYFLYEGTPGGALQINSDFVVRSTGVQTLANVAWEEDLANEEWAFVADPTVGRALYMASHTDDLKTDSFGQQDGVMTKLGFGRKGIAPLLDKTIVPRQFTWGIMNEVTFDAGKPVIYNAYKDLNVSVGAAEARSGASLGSTNPVSFTITGQHTITAVFKPQQFTVNVTTSGQGSVTKTPNKATYALNEQVTLTATPAVDWAFAGWSGDLTGSDNPATVTVTKNMNITATFAQSFTITTSVNPAEGGSITLNPSKPTYQPGEQVQVTATANSGYTFTGWGGALSGSNPTETVTVNSNLNIIANFSSATYTFSATANGNGSVSWEPVKPLYGAGDVVTVTATPATDYYFIGWTGDVNSSTNPLQVTISGNTSIVANFMPVVCYTLTTIVNPPDSGTVTIEPPSNCEGGGYTVGTMVTLTAIPGTQKRFVGWSGGITGSISPIQFPITGDMTVIATFEDDVYPLTTTVVGSGAIAKSPDQPAGYFIGQEVMLTALPASGSEFVGWSGDVTGTSPTVPITITGAMSVTATFTTAGPFTLTVNTAGDGSGTVQISPEKAEYTYGELVELTPVPAPDSVFAGWSGDASGAARPLRVTMTGDKTITATFIVPAGPFSDNFNSCTLANQWSAEQMGDATMSYTGRSLKIQIPEGSDHYINRSLNNAPRLMQDADNRNFEIVAKFDSDLTQDYQTQGILIEGTTATGVATMLRIDFTYNSGVVSLYSGAWTPGKLSQKFSLPIAAGDANYLRVNRTGDKWTLSYSATGADNNWQAAGDFKYIMTVSRAGVFAGNLKPSGGVAPALTTEIDFFQNTAEGPMVEDTPLLTINKVGNGTVTASPSIDQLTCGQTVRLTATPLPGGTFDGWSGDATGTQNPLSMLLNRPRTVTATFTAPDTFTLSLPVIIR